MTLAPEGRVLVGVLLAVAVLASFVGGAAAWAAWLVLLFVAQFFREPTRHITAAKNEIVSPADGRVVFVGPSKSPDGDETLKISVFMNVFNVHANRAPAAGAVLESQRIKGSFFNAALDKASAQNERHLITIDSIHGKITCVQIAGLLARRVLCYAKTGEQLTVGERYGFIRFGSRADVYLPSHLQPKVALGDSVIAGITRIACPQS